MKVTKSLFSAAEWSVFGVRGMKRRTERKCPHVKNLFFLLVSLLLLMGKGEACAQGAQPASAEAPGTVYMVADAHLDTQWNWDVQTTIRKYIWNTMVQNFHLFRQYPDYIFNFEGGVKYAWMKEYYPAQYAELKDWIGKGRWHITGSSWDANETIICSPESWIRNILLGQTFFRQEFGKEGTDVFLPDCFGFPYTMPTLAKHCGLIGFSSQKLVWRDKPFYEGGRRYPYPFGVWEGIDGSKIFMAHGYNYSQRLPDEDLSSNAMLLREVGESDLRLMYHYYGTGDIGGSPTVPSVRGVMKGMKGNGPLKIISATSDQLYKDAIAKGLTEKLPSFRGELYMDLHGNGCYTSQAAMKLYNRQNEHLGDAAERSAVMADWMGAYRYPIGMMTDAWRRIIWHQFHDDVTGTSIPRAYEFSWNDELLSLKQFADVLTTSIGGVARQMDTQVKGTPVVVYNSEAFPVKGLVKVDVGDRAYSVVDGAGRKVPAQCADGKLLFEADVPSTGVAIYGMKEERGERRVEREMRKEESGKRELENSVYRLRLDEHGDMVSLYDKRAQRELVAPGRSIRLVVLDDCKSEAWPAWEILKRTLDKDPLPIHEGVKMELVENGAVRKTLRVSKQYGPTIIRQDLHLYEGADADRIDFETTVDWAAENALLKAEFPLGVANEMASYDLGLGCVQRGNNKENQYEVYSHEWTDLTDRSGSYGVTILNNGRYGWDKPNDNTLRLSLLYAPKPGNNFVYQAHQDKGHHVFTYSIIGHEGALDVAQTARRATAFNSGLRAFTTTRHKGAQGRRFSFVSSDNDNVLIRTMKQAEVSDEYVVRVHELGGKESQKATLTFAADIVAAVEADGTEKTIGAATFEGNRLQVDVNAFGVRTYKVKLRKKDATAIRQQAVELAYNKRCATPNAFRTDADFESGYSYAAELLPEKLTVDGIAFQLGDKDAANGLACEGDTLQVPAGYNRLYLLAASSEGDREATFGVGKTRQTVEVPFYSGFVGQWGHTGQTQGFLKPAQVAYVGTHRHSIDGDEPYEFTYMFKVAIDLPAGTKEVILPNDRHVVLFAATVASESDGVKAAGQLFETSNVASQQGDTKRSEASAPKSASLLKGMQPILCSGYVNERESPAMLTDGKSDTKWCDTHAAPNFIVYDLGEEKSVSRWRLLHAGAEMRDYITRAVLLQGRNTPTEEWRTLDMLDGNRQNETDRTFAPQSVRYVRLYVVAPTQEINGLATRLYEFELW